MPCIAISTHRYTKGQWRLVRDSIAALFLLCLNWTSVAQAAYEPERRLQALDIPELTWESTQRLQVVDQPLHVRPFSSHQPPVQLAKSLAQHSDIFQRVLTSQHKIVLSGLQPGWHWLAEINAVPGGAQGYVSALYVEGARLQASGNDKVLEGTTADFSSLSLTRK
ncbi:hypothetical protein H0A58_03225 [Alcaligenaceae bacterium]|nr:hypothetical protein [Alcaligenaceae bacterium]